MNKSKSSDWIVPLPRPMTKSSTGNWVPANPFSTVLVDSTGTTTISGVNKCAQKKRARRRLICVQKKKRSVKSG